MLETAVSFRLHIAVLGKWVKYDMTTANTYNSCGLYWSTEFIPLINTVYYLLLTWLQSSNIVRSECTHWPKDPDEGSHPILVLVICKHLGAMQKAKRLGELCIGVLKLIIIYSIRTSSCASGVAGFIKRIKTELYKKKAWTSWLVGYPAKIIH